MRFATFGLLLALAAWLGVTAVASLSERTFALMDDGGMRSLYSDRSTVTALNWVDERRQAFRCLFLQSSGSHFCGLNIQLGDGARQGIDLSGYSKVRLGVEYKGPAEKARLVFRNAFKDTSISNDSKFHQVNIPIRKGAYVYEIPLDNFEVAEWWLYGKQLEDAKLRAPERLNVVHFGLDVETPMPIGQHYFNVLEFSLAGPWLNAAHAGWWAAGSALYFVLVGLVYNFFRLRGELKQRSEEMFGLLRKLERVDTESAHFRKLSMYDPLTGLLNRRAALDLVEKFARHNSLVGTTLVVMDIDHFKQVNDTYGHDLGDEVLKHTSAAVQDLLREGDAAVRWGGEEIVVICPRTTSAGAVNVAEKLRSAIKGLRFSNPQLTISASFGVAEIQPGESFNQAFCHADEALYRAKHGGRDRVCEHQEDTNNNQ